MSAGFRNNSGLWILLDGTAETLWTDGVARFLPSGRLELGGGSDISHLALGGARIVNTVTPELSLPVITEGYAIFVAGRMLSTGVTEVVPYVPVLIVTVVLLVLVLIVGHTAAAIASRPEGRDERDRLIEWRAENNSSWVLGAGVLAAIFGMATPIGPAWIANGLLAAMFLAIWAMFEKEHVVLD